MGKQERSCQADIHCPRCGSSALNRYGRSPQGKERYICLVCNRQFVLSTNRGVTNDRPQCPLCGSPMHVYMREPGFVRFRCSHYPVCRGYYKREEGIREK
ncbi:IS1/IS1595 family N-terminal zinc-binding domain-containing protein [Desulfatiglans anilini]|uniref:IS1/IS1595 family N-terminal zinc-binding domain-containing protein n=1 Tax=Desulfatiglans anilini TaxID=90728 RepID=UPI0009FD2179